MVYFDATETFSLQLIEGSVVTECKLRTMASLGSEQDEDAEDGVVNNMPLRSEFKSAETTHRCIIDGPQLREAFCMLQEMSGAASVSILLSPEAPFFRIKTHGQVLSCSVDFPKGPESLQEIKCKEAKECTYRLSLLQQAGKALLNADKTNIRMNANGSLALQHIINAGENKQTHVDYYILADLPEEEDQGEEEQEQQEGREQVKPRRKRRSRHNSFSSASPSDERTGNKIGSKKSRKVRERSKSETSEDSL